MMANKFLTDIDDEEFHTNDVWAECAGTSVRQINKLEMQVLELLVCLVCSFCV
jgi:hypothetical protein